MQVKAVSGEVACEKPLGGLLGWRLWMGFAAAESRTPLRHGRFQGGH